MTKELETLREEQTVVAGEDFSKILAVKKIDRALVIFLEGDLGAGKTTFTKGIMRGLGHEGLVKSPTYNLIEIYETEQLKVFHFDLFRIKDPYELEEIGIREYLEEPSSACIFEWPINAKSLLPEPDYQVNIEHLKETEPESRKITFK
jgi:tRNA threonylcarbamoyladenosine biosynthesis protein TsaE